MGFTMIDPFSRFQIFFNFTALFKDHENTGITVLNNRPTPCGWVVAGEGIVRG